MPYALGMATSLATEMDFISAPVSTVVRNSVTGIRYRKDTLTAWYPQNDPFPAGIRHRDMVLMAYSQRAEFVVEDEHQHNGFGAGSL